MNQVICCWVFVAVIARITYAASDDLVVKTAYGPIKGHSVKSYEGRTVAAFEGIPYAKPPVGDLRFREPQPIEPWNKTLTANKKYTCLQYISYTLAGGTTGDEDCLYLYVYVPRETIKPNENLDVVVFIHGGAFSFGDPQTWGGYEYVMDRDIVYVTMNYRLGILGFLSTQDEIVPGNNGLKDQTCALKWIKENIENFGGNPYSITLAGQSAGAASVHLHYVSPMSTGLFNRGISHSGTALNTFALAKTPLQNARKLGSLLNCSTVLSKDLIDCLRNKPVKEVVSAQRNFFKFINLLPLVPFGPVIEFGNPLAFLPDHPYKLIMEGRVNDCPWVVSTTKDEGLAPAGFIVLYNQLQDLEQKWDELAPVVFDFNDTANDVDKTPIARAIKSYYLRNEPVSMENIKDLIRIFTDRHFYVDTIKAASLQAKVQAFPVYYYFYEYYIDAPVFFKGNLSGVAHSDDTKLLYRQADNPSVLSDSDRKMKDIFLDFLSSYASRGIPTFNGNHWPPFHSSSELTNYMHVFSPDTIRPERAVNTESFAFWQQLPLWENERVLPYLTTSVAQLWPLYF